MISGMEEKECTGCSACINICPQNCITMQANDQDGFLYPTIDEARCIHCHLCEKICPSLYNVKFADKKEPLVKAAWSLNESIRYHSTSGGIFSELALEFLHQGGNVVGARYTKDFMVEHHLIKKAEDIEVLRQSKYIQSNKKDIFKQIKSALQRDEKVLFVGSPCEVAGLYSFLMKPYENLTTIDFVCLGANSPQVYLKFLETLEIKYKSKVKKVWFKNKTHGWNRFSTKVEFDNGAAYLKDRNHDYFMRGYIGKNKFYIRPCCTSCKYKEIPRVSDLTLADFWGVANKDIKLDEDKGTSLVMINSTKGNDLFQKIQLKIYSCDCELKDALGGNMAIFHSAQLDSRREQFFRDLRKMRFDQLIDQYCAFDRIAHIKMLVRRSLKKVIRLIKE